MKKYILFIIFLLVSIISKSQEVIEYNSDTLITITHRELNTINSIIVDYEMTQEELGYYKKLSLMDSVLINTKDSIITEKDLILRKKEDYYINLNNGIQATLVRERNKYRIVNGSLIGAIVVLVTIILCK